jgi:hypothetical protein
MITFNYLKLKAKIIAILTISTFAMGIFFVNFFPNEAIKIRNLAFTKTFKYSIYNAPIYNKLLIDNFEVLSKYKRYQKKLNLINSLLPTKYKSNIELEKILAIANITDTVYNGIFAGGGTYSNLSDLESHLLNPSRGGRCSDYSEYFLSQLILNGFVAREVSNLNHTAIEVYLTSLNKWIWVDSQFDILVLDGEGNILNGLEISKLKTESLVFFSFNKKLQGFYKKFPECYISNNPFKQIVYSLDSRVFTFDLYRKYFPNRKLHSIFMTIFLEKNKMIYNEQ